MKKWTLRKKGKISGSEYTKSLKIPDHIGQIMLNRGIESPEDVDIYINPDLSRLRDPFLLSDMDKAVERINRAIENGEKICIYGDYDVDGVCSSSLLLIFFRSIGVDVDYYVPNRLLEGYGMNMSAIDHIVENYKSDLIITVDCGITSVKEVDYANSHGIDVIVTDHHECQEEIPRAYAVVDPKKPNCSYPFKGICGCGVAFKLIHALLGDEKFFKDIDRYLEIVSLATICDIMPVLDENRVIVKNGLELMHKGNNIGIQMLARVCALENEKIRSSHLGFSLGPRINAAGRLGFSNLGIELLTSTDPEEAYRLAVELDEKNTERQDIEQRMFLEADSIIKSDPKYDEEKVIVIGSHGWHHGIIGIVASKLQEKYYKPTILVCIEDGVATGSARSVKGFDIFEALYECRDLMERFGGHTQAAGLTIKEENIEKLRQKINEKADYIIEEELIENVKIEFEVDTDILDLDFVDSLSILEPFGMKNPTPLFLLRDAVVTSSFLMGQHKQHLKLNLSKDDDIECVGFNIGYMKDRFEDMDMVDVVFQADKNTYNSNTKVQLLLKDIRRSRPKNVKNDLEALKNIQCEIEKAYRKLDNLHTDDEYREAQNKNFQNIYFEESRSIDLKLEDCIFKDRVFENCNLYEFLRHITDELHNLDTKNYDMGINNDISMDSEDSILNKFVKNSRRCEVQDFIDEDTLLLYSTVEGYYRAISDENISGFEKNLHMYSSNIDKNSIKRYNKVIIYDYFEDIDQIGIIFENKKDYDNIIFNFDYRDFIYLKNKMNDFSISRDDFVKVYKTVKGINSTIGISELLGMIQLRATKLLIAMSVLKDEGLIDYRMDFDRDIIEFIDTIPPDKKKNLEDNRMVRYLGHKLENFNTLYKFGGKDGFKR